MAEKVQPDCDGAGPTIVVAIGCYDLAQRESLISQLFQHPGEGHLGVSGLEAALYRGLDTALSLGTTHSPAPKRSELRLKPASRERNRIDTGFDGNAALGGERWRSDASAPSTKSPSKAAGSARLIQPYSFRELRVVVLARST